MCATKTAFLENQVLHLYVYVLVLVYCKYEHEDIHLGHMYVIKGLFYILKRKPFLFTGLCQFKWIQSTAEKKV